MWLIKEARTEMNDQCCVTLFLRTTSVSPICLHVFPLPKSWAWNQFEKVDNHPSAISQDDPDFKYYILCVISMNGSEIPVFHHPNSLFCPGNRTKVYVRPQAPGFGKEVTCTLRMWASPEPEGCEWMALSRESSPKSEQVPPKGVKVHIWVLPPDVLE